MWESRGSSELSRGPTGVEAERSHVLSNLLFIHMCKLHWNLTMSDSVGPGSDTIANARMKMKLKRAGLRDLSEKLNVMPEYRRVPSHSHDLVQCSKPFFFSSAVVCGICRMVSPCGIKRDDAGATISPGSLYFVFECAVGCEYSICYDCGTDDRTSSR